MGFRPLEAASEDTVVEDAPRRGFKPLEGVVADEPAPAQGGRSFIDTVRKVVTDFGSAVRENLPQATSNALSAAPVVLQAPIAVARRVWGLPDPVQPGVIERAAGVRPARPRSVMEGMDGTPVPVSPVMPPPGPESRLVPGVTLSPAEYARRKTLIDAAFPRTQAMPPSEPSTYLGRASESLRRAAAGVTNPIGAPLARGAVQGLEQLYGMGEGFARGVADLTGWESAADYFTTNRREREQFGANIKRLTGLQGVTQEAIANILANAPFYWAGLGPLQNAVTPTQMATIMESFAVTKAPTLAMSIGSGSATYNDPKYAHLSGAERVQLAAADAFWEFLGEQMGFGETIKALKTRGMAGEALTQRVKALVGESLGEGMTELGQIESRMRMGLEDGMKPAQLLERVAGAAAMGAVVSGGMQAAAGARDAVGRRFGADTGTVDPSTMSQADGIAALARQLLSDSETFDPGLTSAAAAPVPQARPGTVPRPPFLPGAEGSPPVLPGDLLTPEQQILQRVQEVLANNQPAPPSDLPVISPEFLDNGTPMVVQGRKRGRFAGDVVESATPVAALPAPSQVASSPEQQIRPSETIQARDERDRTPVEVPRGQLGPTDGGAITAAMRKVIGQQEPAQDVAPRPPAPQPEPKATEYTVRPTEKTASAPAPDRAALGPAEDLASVLRASRTPAFARTAEDIAIMRRYPEVADAATTPGFRRTAEQTALVQRAQKESQVEQEDRRVDQISPERAMELNTPSALPTDPVFREAVTNTPGAELTDNGLELDLVRFQKPEQEGDESVRTGVFYLPAGASQERGYRGSNRAYGGTERMDGRTLLRRPMFVKGATGGKAPQAAYDSIKGRGAYEAMRTDVLRATRNYAEPMVEKAGRVADVLKQYGADPRLASNIVRYSTQGNTLPYAIQENIVAHAVREAGYDSVVGYSKGKGGNRISEVFDVRETTYPSNVLNPEVHPDFEEDRSFDDRTKRPGSDAGHKREAATGRYVGAPDWVGNSPQKLIGMRRKLHQLALEGEAGRFWYENSSKAILELVGGDKAEAEKLVSLIAIYSPNATVPANTTMALTAYFQWKAGQPIDAGFGEADKKAESLLRKGVAWKGIKTNSFYQNLMVEIDASKLDPGVATMDMWMALAFDYGQKALDQGPKYKFAEREIQRLADELGWKAHQVQAAIWTAMKGRIDPIRPALKERELKLGIGKMVDKVDSKTGKTKQVYEIAPDKRYEHYRLAHKMGMAYDLRTEDIEASKYDFSNAIGERLAQISWEATPGEKTGVLPGIHKANMQQLAEYLDAVLGVIAPNNRDLIAEKIGLPEGTTMVGYSAWAGGVGVGAQTFLAVPSAGAGKTRGVKPAARQLLDQYAALKGYILNQEAVVWHIPVYDDAQVRQNGAEIRTTRALTADELDLLYKALHDKFGTWDLAPGYTANGARVLNFVEGLDNKAFHDGVNEILGSLPDDFGGGLADAVRYRSDGNYVFNDWQESPDGQGYAALGWAGRPDLQEWAAELRARVASVNEDFAKRYGWGEDRQVDDRTDRRQAEADRPAGRLAEDSGSVDGAALGNEGDIEFNDGSPPRKTVTAYKLFRVKDGQLYPLFIGAKEAVPIGQWLDAKSIPTKGFAQRPGWHAGVLPMAPHLRGKDNRISSQRVWAEVELPADVDWQGRADQSRTRDIRDRVPAGGHYRFRTNKMQGGAWLIGGSIKVKRVLSNDDVRSILEAEGQADQADAESQANAALFAGFGRGATDDRTPSRKIRTANGTELGFKSPRNQRNVRALTPQQRADVEAAIAELGPTVAPPDLIDLLSFAMRIDPANGSYFPDQRVVTLSPRRLEMLRSSDAEERRDSLRTIAHEIAHAIDHEAAGGGIDAVSMSSDRLSTNGYVDYRSGDLFDEAYEVWFGADFGTELNRVLSYPMEGLSTYSFGDKVGRLELFAQVSSLYNTNLELVREKLPKWAATLEQIYGNPETGEGAPQSADEIYRRLRKALSNEGASARAEERVPESQTDRSENAVGPGPARGPPRPGVGTPPRGGAQPAGQRTVGGGPRGQGAAAGPTWGLNEPSLRDRLLREWQDKFIDVKRVREEMRRAAGLLTEGNDAYLAEELYHGRVSARVNKAARQHIDPLLEAMRETKTTADELGRYLWARHAPERNKQMAKVNPGGPGNLSGLYDDAAAAARDGNPGAPNAADIIAEFRKASHPRDFRKAGRLDDLNRLAGMVDAITKATQQILVSEGLESQATIDAWNNAYKHYVPLMRDTEAASAGQGFKVMGPESKRAMGSQREAIAILAAVISQHERAIIRAERAKVGRALVKMAEDNPNPDFWRVDTPPMRRTINPSTGLVQVSTDPLYRQRDDVFVVKDKGPNGTVIERVITFNPSNERAMAIAQAMNNLGVVQLGAVTKIVGWYSRLLANLATSWNPQFWVTNAVRDVQTAAVNLQDTELRGMAPQVIANIPKAMAGIVSAEKGQGTSQWAQTYRAFQDAGGQTGWMQMWEDLRDRQKYIAKQLDRANRSRLDPREIGHAALEYIELANTAIENAIRVSAFAEARKLGLTDKRAASIAKNMTVNFNRKGNRSVAANAWYMFFNASVQGTARLVKAVATSRRARLYSGMMVAFSAALEIINRLLWDDDRDPEGNVRYELIPEHVKQKNMIFMLPDGKHVAIPLPYGFNVFHTAGRLMAEAVLTASGSPTVQERRKPIELAWAFGETVLDAFVPLGQTATPLQYVMPTVADPFVQYLENKTFFGSPMRPEPLPQSGPMPDYKLYFRSTSDTAKDLARWLSNTTGGDERQGGAIDISPTTIEHIVRTATGGTGQFGLVMFDFSRHVIDRALGNAEAEDYPVRRIPFVGKFYGEVDDRDMAAKYYRLREDATKALKLLKGYQQDGDLEAAAKVEDEKGPLIAMAREISSQQYRRSMSEVSKQFRSIDSLPREERAKERRMLQRDEATLMARALRAYNEAQEQR